jgi:phosphoserine phosphatase
MAHVVRLIADPERTPLDGATVATLERALGSRARWLSDDEACELPVESEDGRALRARIEAALGNPPYDIGIVPAGARQKRLLIITIECIDELAEHLGVKAEVSAITRRAMNGELTALLYLQGVAKRDFALS